MENPKTGSEVSVSSDQSLSHILEGRKVLSRGMDAPHRYLIYSGA